MTTVDLKNQNGEMPLSESAQDAKEVMQREFLRTMANKMMATALEDERARKIKDLQSLGAEGEDAVRKNAYNQLIMVQEDLIKTLNLMKVKGEIEMEQSKRIVEGKKQSVHDELIRKNAAKEADKQIEEERMRRIEEGKVEFTEERQGTYDKLVVVQEDLLKKFRKMKADGEIKLEQERRIIVGNKQVFQEQLVHQIGTKTADLQMEKEKNRRTEDLNDAEIERRVAIAHRMIDVQKELLATHKPVQAIEGTISQKVLEEAKGYVHEQLRRKAAQKEAIAAMDEEQKRRISESDPEDNKISDARAEFLEAISRQANTTKAKEMVDATQKEYMQAELKARSQEDTVRKINQKCVDKAMDEEKVVRVSESCGKDLPHINEEIKKELSSHSK